MPNYYVAGMFVGDELYHYGIMGQKWGIRRYQNADGTLTPAGKARYGTDAERAAAKDAQRMFDANAAYGSGSVIRKRLISREIAEKSKNAEYAKAYKEASKFVDTNKSYKRAEKLKKHEGVFNRGWALSERGKTVGKIILNNFADLGITALSTGSAYYIAKQNGYKVVPKIILAAGGAAAINETRKAISDSYSLAYYNRNRKF